MTLSLRLSPVLVLLVLSVVPAVLADPILLSDPVPAAGPALNGVAIGGAPHGFLLAGTASHKPVAVPLDAEGSPRVIGVKDLGLPTASAVGEPVFIDDRWIVPISPDFLNPERLFIAEMRDDGTLVRAPRAYPFPRMAFAEVVAGSDRLLVVATRSEGVNRYSLLVRTLSRDLETLGAETALPGTLVFPGAFVRSFRAIRSGDGFLVAYATDSALRVARLSKEGALVGDPIVVAEATDIVSPDIVTIAADAMIVWAELVSPANWSLRSARVSTRIDFIHDVAMIQGSQAPVVFLRRTRGDLNYAVWQGIDHRDGRRVGSRIYVQWLNPEARPEREPGGYFVQDEVLVGAASSGDLLIAWEKHVVGLGVSLQGFVVGKNVSLFSGAERVGPLRLSLRAPRSLAMSATGDGTTTAVWIEKSSTGELFFISRYDRNGERLVLEAPLSGRFGSIDVASGGGLAMIVWQEDTAIRGAILNEDLSRNVGALATIAVTANPQSDPHVTWDGSRFVIMWREADTLSAAFVSTSGALDLRRTLVRLPVSSSTAFYFRPFSLHIAANATGIVAVATVVESEQRGFPSTSERVSLAIFRFNETGEVVATELQPADSDPMPDVATDGRDFLIISKTSRDLRTQVVGIPPRGSSDERVLFDWVSPFRPLIAWSGSEYVAAWSYGLGNNQRTAAIRLDRSGEPGGPLRTIPNGGDALAAFPGDALLGWIGGLTEDQREEAVFGEFFRNAQEFAGRRRATRRP